MIDIHREIQKALSKLTQWQNLIYALFFRTILEEVTNCYLVGKGTLRSIYVYHIKGKK